MNELVKNKDPLDFDITASIFIDSAIFPIAGSTVDTSQFSIPSRPVISKFEKEIGLQAIVDYDDFIENITNFIEDYLELELIHTNASKKRSRYFSFIARDEDGTIYLRFRLRLRISNHNAHSTKQQKLQKKHETEQILKEEKLTEYDLRKMQKLTKSIIVNNETYSSYTDAFIDISEQAEEWVEKMRK